MNLPTLSPDRHSTAPHGTELGTVTAKLSRRCGWSLMPSYEERGADERDDTEEEQRQSW